MIDPQAHDEATAKLHEDAARAQGRLDAHNDAMHRLAGDRKEWIGRNQYWRMTGAQVQDQLCGTDKGQQASAKHGELQYELAVVMTAIHDMEEIYRNNGRWTRYFPCLNADGHIHVSLRACPSVRWDTRMGWYPSLSGKTVEECVAELGPALCSICFPLAPVEHKSMTLGQVERERNRAERDSAKAAREAVKNAKRLTEDEVFRSSYGRDTIETVAACKDAIRKAVDTEEELKVIGSSAYAATYPGDIARLVRNVTDNLAQQREDAAKATTVLLAREARTAGHGATQADIDKMVAAKHKSAAKAWAQSVN